MRSTYERQRARATRAKPEAAPDQEHQHRRNGESEKREGKEGRGAEAEHARRQYGEEIERAARSRRSRSPGAEEQRRRSRSTMEAEHRRPEPFKSTRRSPSAAAPQFCFLRVCRTGSAEALKQAAGAARHSVGEKHQPQRGAASDDGGALTFSATWKVYQRHTVPHTTHLFQPFQIRLASLQERAAHQNEKTATPHIYYCSFSRAAPFSDLPSDRRRSSLPFSAYQPIGSRFLSREPDNQILLHIRRMAAKRYFKQSARLSAHRRLRMGGYCKTWSKPPRKPPK